MPEPFQLSRRRDREQFAEAIATAAARHGARIIDRRDHPDRTDPLLAHPSGLWLSVGFNGEHGRGRAFVLAWFLQRDDGARIAPFPLWEVNPYHGRKATTIASDPAAALSSIAAGFGLAEAGEAVTLE